MFPRQPIRSLILVGSIFLFSCTKEHPAIDLPVPPVPVVVPPPILKPVSVAINSTIGGFYLGVPAEYNETQHKYPLLIFLHGGGQFGNGTNDLPLLLNDGVPQLLDEKKFPGAIKMKDSSYSFVILAPQFSRYPAVGEIIDVLEYAKKNYRVDERRVYLSGLSLGGTVTCDVAAEYPTTFAAIVPISGVSGEDLTNKSRKIAANNLPVWIFHNTGDPIASYVSATNFNTSLRSFSPSPLPRLTLFESPVHDAWTKAIDPAYKENNLNIYEWMLQYNR